MTHGAHLTLFASLLASVLVAVGARAQELEAGEPRAGEPSWADYFDSHRDAEGRPHDGRRRARQLRRMGLAKLLDARANEVEGLGPPPEVLYEQALIRFERARRALPDDPDLLFFIAVALAGWRREVDGVEERRTEEAVAAFLQLREAFPQYHPDSVSAELGVLYGRMGEHAAAVEEYQRAIAAALPRVSPLHYFPADRERRLLALFEPPSTSTMMLNLAEMQMLLGELDSSIASYRQAEEEARATDPFSRALALWGLALALDRAGYHSEAMAAARQAIEGDPIRNDDARLGIDHASHGPMAILHSSMVFFEPEHEVHAYDAIGWETLARLTSNDSDRQQVLGRARRAWRQFLTGGGNRSRFAEHAREAAARLQALEAETAPAR